MTTTDAPVLIEERPAGGGYTVAFACLNAERALNSLSQAMIAILQPKLAEWARRDDVAAVVLHGAGEKAFCAGGDVIGIHAALRAADGAPSADAEAFFAAEYRLDHSVHRFPKPVLCWGHGIVMGGGLGLMAGASHRVVTEASRIAMPEVTIGLFPDVGASWFLGRMPGGIGRFLGMTTTPMRAGDALWLNMADFRLDGDDREAVFEALTALRWSGERAADDARLSQLLRRFEDGDTAATERRESPLFERQATIAGLDDAADAAAFVQGLQAAANQDAFFEHGVRAIAGASPTSLAVVHRQLAGDPRAAIETVLQRDYAMAVACSRRPDLAEGIRALLVDKDKQPAWSPARLADVRAADVDAHFRLPDDYGGPHPLADLSADGPG